MILLEKKLSYIITVNPYYDETAPTNWQSECWLYGVFLTSQLLSNVLFIVWRQNASVPQCAPVCPSVSQCATASLIICVLSCHIYIAKCSQSIVSIHCREKDEISWLTNMTKLALPVNIPTFTNRSDVRADTESPENISIVSRSPLK